MFFLKLKHQGATVTLNVYYTSKTLKSEHIKKIDGDERQNMCDGWKEFDIMKFMLGLMFHWLLQRAIGKYPT